MNIFVSSFLKTNQGIQNLFAEEAANLTATDPDYGIRDLYDAIAMGNFPSWTFYIQVMTFEEAERFRWNPFDVTKARILIVGLFNDIIFSSEIISH
jgi:catalase